MSGWFESTILINRNPVIKFDLDFGLWKEHYLKD